MPTLKISRLHSVPCPRHKRMVPVFSYSHGVRPTEPTCLKCELLKRRTCNYVFCKYDDTKQT